MQIAKDASEDMMPFFQRNIFKRVIVSLVVLPVMAMVIYYGQQAFMITAMLVAFLMSREWLRLTHPEGVVGVNNLFYMCLFGSFIFWLSGLYLWAFLYFAAVTVCYYGAVKFKSFKHPNFMSAGLPYIFLPMISALWLRLNVEGGLYHLVFVILIVIMTDTSAYFSGRFIGGPKLAPKISPNKTWAGFFGGVAGAMMAAYFFEAYTAYQSVMPLFVMTILLSVIGQIGDLFESYAKRYFGVKDSGTLLPGHGGILDRLDSYLFAIPVMALIILFTA